MAKKILLVDDDPAFNEINRTILESAGYEVEEALTASEALEKLAGQTFDLLILDLMMEEKDAGFKVAYKIRSDEKLKSMPILMLTSAQEKTGFTFDIEKDRHWLKVDDLAAKPLKPVELLERVARLLQKGK